MNEMWKKVPGFPGYEASSLGRVRSRWTRPSVMRLTENENGYLTVRLRRDGRYFPFRVNRLVLLAHVGEPERGQVGAHRDGNKKNNKLGNLRWASRKENERDKIAHGRTNRGARNGMSRLTESDARAIRSARPSSMAECLSVARRFGVSGMCVYKVATGRRWSHL